MFEKRACPLTDKPERYIVARIFTRSQSYKSRVRLLTGEHIPGEKGALLEYGAHTSPPGIHLILRNNDIRLLKP